MSRFPTVETPPITYASQIFTVAETAPIAPVPVRSDALDAFMRENVTITDVYPFENGITFQVTLPDSLPVPLAAHLTFWIDDELQSNNLPLFYPSGDVRAGDGYPPGTPMLMDPVWTRIVDGEHENDPWKGKTTLQITAHLRGDPAVAALENVGSFWGGLLEFDWVIDKRQ